MKRVKPLSNIQEIKDEARQEFETKWKEGSLPGWPKKEDESTPSTGLFCLACKKQYAKDTVYNAHLTSKKHIKAAAALAASGTSEADVDVAEMQSKVLTEKAKPEEKMARTEIEIQKVAEILKTQIEDTKENVERRQTLTGRERDVSDVWLTIPCCFYCLQWQLSDVLKSRLLSNSLNWRQIKLSWKSLIRRMKRRCITR